MHPPTWFSARTSPADASADRFRDWSRIIGHAFGTQQALPLKDPEGFYGHFRHASLGSYALSTVVSGPEEVFHSAGNAPESEPYFHLNFLASGSGGQVRQGGTQSALEPGSFVLTDANQDYSFRFDGPMKLVVLHLPPARLRSALTDPGQATAVAAAGDTPESAPLRALLDSLAASPAGGNTSTQFLASAAVDTALAGLIRVLGTETAAETTREAHVGRIKAHIEGNLSDPAMTPSSIAKAVHLSLRQLHSVFEPEGTTVAKYVLQRRLDQAVLLLAEPRLRNVSISDIGGRVGFVDASHFGRAFRRQFDAAPGSFRAGQSHAPGQSRIPGQSRAGQIRAGQEPLPPDLGTNRTEGPDGPH
ncbi:helix-turn-helix domain-containing protein [Arthrobacter luteolus]|uniref:AraC-like ligand-binding domain-containing protein n=1 Tax=Arthrobacter luteolus TaxID=98672 RepID=UPI0008321FBE|nr:helix-turn-helix domain-containing protein [Arthrobacter luteolus]